MSALGITFGAVLAVLTADLAYRRFATRRIQDIIENVPTFAAIPAPSRPDLRAIRIPTEDGLTLEASLDAPAHPPAGLVIFCPELNGNRWTARHYAEALVDAGFAVLAFDFRNQGASDHQPGYAPIHWVTEFELTDVQAVLNFVDSDPELSRLPLGIFGVSRGGSAALLSACRFPQIQAVVTDSGFSTMAMIRHFMNKFSRFVVPDWFFRRLPRWHIELVLRQTLARSERFRHCRYVHLEHEAKQFDRPVLLISGSRDSYVTPNVTMEIAETLNCLDQIWIVDRAKHNKSRQRAKMDYDQRIVAHFRKHLSRQQIHPISSPRPDKKSSRVA
ncbi:MAG: alpha/beta fold hydrolase [Fuerstiella sp.]